MLEDLVLTLGDTCDFLHPRMHSAVVLQNVHYVTNAICTALYDGVKEEDLLIIMTEVTKLCVPVSASFAYMFRFSHCYISIQFQQHVVVSNFQSQSFIFVCDGSNWKYFQQFHSCSG